MVVLASHLSLKDAQMLKESLCKHLQDGAAVTLDARSVERVDTASIQLLCAFVRDRAARQQQVQWLGDSQALREAARLLGVTELLALAPTDSHTSPGVAA